MATAPSPDSGGAEPELHLPALEVVKHGAGAAERLMDKLGPGHFSQAAATEFRRCVEAYAADLGREAVRVAERHQADVVSPSYVRQAASYLVARVRDRKLAAVGSLGAMLLGVALPPLFEMPWAQQVSPTRVLVSAVFGMAGSLLLTIRHVKQ